MAPAFVPAVAARLPVVAASTPAPRVCVATAAGRRGHPAAAAATAARGAPRPAAGRGPPPRVVSLARTSDAGDAAGDAGGKRDDPTASAAGGADGAAAGGSVDVPSAAPPPATPAAAGDAEGALENLEGAFDASLLTGLEGALDRDWDRLEASFFSAVEGAEKAKEQEAAEVEEVEIPRAPVPMPVRSFGRTGDSAGGAAPADDSAAADGDALADGAGGATAGGGPPGADAAVLPGVVAAEDAGAASVAAAAGTDAGAGAVDDAAAAAEVAPKAKRGRKKKAPTLLAPTAGTPAADGSAPPDGDGGDELGFVVEKDMFLETAAEHRWYSLQVKPGTENSVRIALQNMCVAVPRLAKQLRHVLVPAVAVQALTKSGKQVTREERLFPGYMLVCMAMDRQSYQDVRSVTHVQGFMGDPNREKKKKDPMRPPDAISADTIAEINAKLAAAKLAMPPPPGGGVAAAMGYAPADPAATALAAAAAGSSPAAASGAGAAAAAAGVGASDAAADGAAPAADAGLQAGDTVRIETGAHAGAEGVITLVNPAAATVRVTLDIFGVATPVDVAAADVVRAAAPPPPMEDDPEFGLGLADL